MAFSQALGLRWAWAHGQDGGAANADQQRAEEQAETAQQRKAGGGTKDLAERNGVGGGLEEGQRGRHGVGNVQLFTI